MPAPRPRGVVVTHAPGAPRPHGHESLTRATLAERLAALREYEYGGEYDADIDYQAPLYFVPADTLVADAPVCAAIRSANDLFGGVVPHAFVATKAITHPLLDAGSQAPTGWSPGFARQVHDVVLPGYSAYTRADGLAAGRRLLARAPVRVKRVDGIGGESARALTTSGQT